MVYNSCMGTKIDTLNPLELQFCELYLSRYDPARRDGQAYKCYQEVFNVPPTSEGGPTYSALQMKAAALLRKPAIKAYLDERTQHFAALANVTKEQILTELRYLAMSRLPGIVNYNGTRGEMSITDFEALTSEQRACIKSFKHKRRTTKQGKETAVEHTVEVELYNKLQALDMLARYTGLEGESKAKNAQPIELTLNLGGKPAGGV